MGVSGILYVIFGIFIGVVSRIVYTSNHKMVFLFFFWIGILFCVIGAGKIAMKKYLKKDEKTAKLMANQEGNKTHYMKYVNPAPNKINNLQQNQRHEQHSASVSVNQTKPNYVSCLRCGSRNHLNANFCSYCGNRVR
jgi:hypothetical protein